MLDLVARNYSKQHNGKVRQNAHLPASMARRAKEPDLEADQQEHQIIEALERKRRQLDQEIADFKARKEHDYRAFERQLRDKSKENGGRDAQRDQRRRGRFQPKNIGTEAGCMQNEGASQVQRESDDVNLVQTNPGSEAEAAVESTSNPEGSPDPPGRFTRVLRERENGFHGVFTPSYLPFVEGTPANQSEEHLQPPVFSPQDLSAAKHNGSAMLSSSAETVHPPMASPPQAPARALSSSVPPEKPSHHRSDSSRSDNSIASLRSSLRDPKQPRSPKRVLFSIDDTVVAPSTSPIAHRSKPVTFKKPAERVDAIGGFEKFEVVRNHNSNAPAVNRFESNGIGFPSSGARANGWTAGLLTFGRAAESNPATNSPSASGGDDFEHLESDDLFTFDEDLGRTGKSKAQETDIEDEHDEHVESHEKRSKEPLTGSSPHAGSLPIEIKWPGRREDKG